MILKEKFVNEFNDNVVLDSDSLSEFKIPDSAIRLVDITNLTVKNIVVTHQLAYENDNIIMKSNVTDKNNCVTTVIPRTANLPDSLFTTIVDNAETIENDPVIKDSISASDDLIIEDIIKNSSADIPENFPITCTGIICLEERIIGTVGGCEFNNFSSGNPIIKLFDSICDIDINNLTIEPVIYLNLGSYNISVTGISDVKTESRKGENDTIFKIYNFSVKKEDTKISLAKTVPEKFQDIINNPVTDYLDFSKKIIDTEEKKEDESGYKPLDIIW